MSIKRSSHLFTSESVTEGHPDKVCDRISDSVVDAFLAADPYARVACETLVTNASRSTSRSSLMCSFAYPGNFC